MKWIVLGLLAWVDWTQWGGPHGNFQTDSKGLANSWPPEGPKQLWSRPLGEGYSAIVCEGNTLYTMCRRGNEEVITALDAGTGKPLWVYGYDATFRPGMGMENGPGPHATPLVTENGVYAIGILANLLCLDKKTGKVKWSHDLYKEFDGTYFNRGYSPSPIAYRNLVIVKVGGPGRAVVAFNQKDGAVVWKRQDFDNAPATPIVINVDGLDQLVVFTSGEVAGLNPLNGDLQWTHPHRTQYGLNISTPVWGEGNILYISSAYNGGSRAIQLTRSGNQVTPKELWYTNRMRIHHGTAVRIGDYVYGSSGDFGPAPLTCIQVKTGKIMWQDRSFSKASFVYADGKLILVDEDGNLALATVSPEGLKVHSKVQLLSHNAWTAPTLVGTKLYIRDRSKIMALELR